MGVKPQVSNALSDAASMRSRPLHTGVVRPTETIGTLHQQVVALAIGEHEGVPGELDDRMVIT